jgi:catalase
MHGFGSHTLSLWNQAGERYWVKWHFKTLQGVRTLSADEAAKLDAAGAQRDLVDAIDRGEFPQWSVELQIMTEAEARDYHINPFDLTKVWPYRDFPLQRIGLLELNRNVDNYFAETEQAAFAPSNLVPGVGASPDKMLQARLLAYQDAHRYRLSANFNQIPVNQPRCPVSNYQRDGLMSGACPIASGVNFYPNDQVEQGAPAPVAELGEPPMPLQSEAWIKGHSQDDEDYYSQAGDLYRVMSDAQKDQLADNIAGGLQHASESAQQRMLQQYEKADPDYASRVRVRL